VLGESGIESAILRSFTTVFRPEQERRLPMLSETYRDIIDEKIVEWQQSLEKIREMMDRATAERKSLLAAKVTELETLVDTAIVQLYALDERETTQNTMETKEQILHIFSSIDTGLAENQEKIPFML
jgi:hypothetical protein